MDLVENLTGGQCSSIFSGGLLLSSKVLVQLDDMQVVKIACIGFEGLPLTSRCNRDTDDGPYLGSISQI